MSTDENKVFMRRYLDAISGYEKPAALLDQYIADEDEALKQHIAAFEAAFPRYELNAEDMLAEGDEVAVRATIRGTHRGDLQGIPPTGKQVTFPIILIYRLAGGKIVAHWMAYDQLDFLQQLGVVPAPAEVAR